MKFFAENEGQDEGQGQRIPWGGPLPQRMKIWLRTICVSERDEAIVDQVLWAGLEAYIQEKYVGEGLALHETQVIDTDLFGRVDLGEMEPGFSETVIAMAKKKYERLSDFCNKACLSRQVVSKMNTEPGYLPTKHNAFACVIALELPMDEAEELLKRGSYAFSRSSLQDVIVSYFIEQGVYNIDAINVTLYEHGEKTLGSV